ncbi:MAG: glutamate-cysteine ligase family protein [Turicibacter sp.]|nr:glutamate-cysteine ligase family protein [Turicibacter sp.]
MSYRESNIFALTDYFASGCKREQFFGLELEHFVISKTTGVSCGYAGKTPSEPGVAAVLKKLAKFYGNSVFLGENIISVSGKNIAITIEPAAQLEVSIGPFAEIEQILQVYNEFIAAITPILDEMNCKLVCMGYHPTSKIDELDIIPKSRYELMYKYFETVGNCGKYMMKGTAAAQITIDYSSEEDFKKKFRVANAIGPILAIMYHNTPIFEGNPAKTKMLRTEIWNDVDPARSMVVKDALDIDFGFREYAEYIYSTPPIFIMQDGKEVVTAQKTVAELFDDKPLTHAEILHITSIVFPDVRLKTDIEIRMVDSIPIKEAAAYMNLVKNIFYNQAKLDEIYNKTLSITNADVQLAKENLIKDGENAIVYGKPVQKWIEKLGDYYGN